jgi:hypothetical protein
MRFVVANNSAHGRRTAANWWYDCERTRWPYVRVTPRRTYATVSLDMLPTGRELSDDKAQALQALGQRCQPNATSWYWGPSGALFPRVPLADAESVADELLAIATAARNGQDGPA